MATDVRGLARELERAMRREGWQQDRSLGDTLRDVLTKLSVVKVDIQLLQETKLGVLVHQVAKYEDAVVQGYSKALKKRWKEAVGVPEKPKHTPTLEDAKRRVQDRYQQEKEKREARTVRVLSKPIVTGRNARKVMVSMHTAPKKWTAMQQRKPMVSTMQRGTDQRISMMRALPSPSPALARATVPSVQRRMAGMTVRSRPRPASASAFSSSSLDPEERHRLRQERLRAAAQLQEEDRDMQRQETRHHHSSSLGAAHARPSPQARPSQQALPAQQAPRSPADPHKAMLDRMIPRICGTVADLPSTGGKKGKTPGSRPSSAKQKKPVQFSEGQREVLQWLKRLDVDMSQYAPVFFDNGFDSIKLLREVKARDLESMVPKVGHQRMLEKALEDLKRQFMTSATVNRPRPHSVPRESHHRSRRRDPFDDEDSDDSFVVSDGEDYNPGVITAMFKKNGRYRKRALSVDSVESDNMEASFDQIQREEERSKRIGDYEDLREEIRNEKLLKKKKKT